MRTISSILPDIDLLLAMEPEELAGVLLECLNSMEERDSGLNRHSFTNDWHCIGDYPRERRDAVIRPLMEAWAWLEREGLIVPKEGTNGQNGWVFISRRGRTLRNAAAVSAYRSASHLPRQSLHPVIAAKVWATFAHGEYDTAVFQAFREVEVAVRSAAGYGPNEYGVQLMRLAFNKDSGPLRDPEAETGEREACLALFVGAVGFFKNPVSHRHVALNVPAQAAEIIGFASQLMRIVDERAAAASSRDERVTLSQ